MRGLRTVRRMVLWLALVLAASVIALWLHADTSLGRRVVRDFVTDLVSSEIRGSLHIGQVARISLGGIEVRDAELRDEAGETVGIIERVTLVLDPWAALSGTLRFSEARAEGATIRLRPGEGELPTFIEALEPVDPTPREGEPFHAIVDGIEIRGLTLEGELLGLSGLVAREVALSARIEARGEVEVRVTSAQGTVAEPYPFLGHIDGLEMVVDTDRARGLTLRAHGRTEREGGPTDALDVELSYRLAEGAAPDSAPELDIRVRGRPVHARLLRELGYGWADVLQGEMQATLRLHGVPDDLAMEVQAETPGGPVSITGRLGETTTISASTEGLGLGRLVAGIPALEVAGEITLTTDAANPDAAPRVRIEAEPMVYDRIAVPGFVMEGTLEEDHIRIDSITAPHMGGEVSGEGRIGNDGAVQLRVHARVPQIARDPNVRRVAPGARGALAADLRISTDGENACGLDGTVTLRDFRYGPVTADRLHITGRVHGRCDQPRVDVHVLGTNTAIAQFPIGDGTMTMRGGPTRYESAGVFRAPGARTAGFKVRIERDGRAFNVAAERLTYAVGPRAWRGSLTRLRYDPDREVLVDGLVMTGGSGRLQGSGTYRVRGADVVDAEVRGLELASLAALFGQRMPELSGRADGTLHLEGDLSDPVFTVQAALSDATVLDVPGIDAGLDVTYAAGNLQGAVDLNLGTRGRLGLELTGLLDPTVSDPIEALEGGMYQGELSLANVDLGTLRALSGNRLLDAQGRIEGHIRTTGLVPTFAPSFEADLDVPALRFADWPALDLHLAVGYQDRWLAVGGRLGTADAEGSHSAAADRTLVETEGGLLIDVVHLLTHPAEAVASLETLPWRLALRLPPRQLGTLPGPVSDKIPESLRALRTAATITLAGGGFQTRGTLMAFGEWEGDAGALFCEGTPPRFSVEGDLSEGTLTLEGRAFLRQLKVLEVHASAPVPLDDWLRDARLPDAPATEITAVLFPTPMAELPGLCRYGEGQLTASLSGELFTEDPHLDLQVHAPSLRMRGAAPMRAEFTGSVREGRFTGGAEMAWWTGGRAEARVETSATWEPGRAWPTLQTEHFQVSAVFEDAPVTPLLTWMPQVVDVAGTLAGSVEADVAGERLDARGTVALSDGYLELIGLGQHLTDLQGEVDFRGNWARLRGLSARDGDGELGIDGSLAFRGLRPSRARVSVRTEEFPVRQEGTVLATLTSRSTVDARFGGEQAELDVMVDALSIRMPDESARSVQALEPHGEVHVSGDSESEAAQATPYPVRMRVDAPHPFWVRRNDFAVQVSADLDAVYQDPDLLIGGTINLQRGFFEVFGRRFEIEQGQMQFDRAARINPNVNLIAVYTMRRPAGTQVTVTVGGTLASPRVEFSSNHPECDEQGEIVSMLMSGRCGVLPGMELGSEEDAATQAQSVLAGVLAGVLTLQARRELGGVLPVIVIESGDEAFQSARIRAGFQADSLIPGFLRGIVLGAYVEAVFTASGGDASAGESTQSAIPEMRWELQFPYHFVVSGSIEGGEAWSLDLTWEP